MFDTNDKPMNSSDSHNHLDTFSFSGPDNGPDEDQSPSGIGSESSIDKEEFGEWKPVFATTTKRKPSKQWAPMSKSIVEKLLDNSTDHFNEAALADQYEPYSFGKGAYSYYEPHEHGYSYYDEEDEQFTNRRESHDEHSEADHDEPESSMPKATAIDPVRVQNKHDLKQVFARLELRFGDILKCAAIILALVLPFHDLIAEGFNSLATSIAKPISASMMPHTVDRMVATPSQTLVKPAVVKPMVVKLASPVVHQAKYLSMTAPKQRASNNAAIHRKLPVPPAQVLIEVDPSTPRHAYQSW